MISTYVSEAHEAALRYATLGYAILPIKPGAKTPLTAHGLLDASNDPDKINQWFEQNPAANLAISTNNLLVIDVDPEGSTWLADQPDKLLELASGPNSRTPRGGKHFYFRQPAGTSYGNSAGKLGPGVDVRANGGYVLASPSSVNGKSYEWIEPLDCEPERLPLPPAWLLAMLDAATRPTVRVDAAHSANAIPEGQRNNTLASLGGTMRNRGMSGSEILAALRVANAERCKPSLPDSEVETIAWSVSRYEPDQAAVTIVDGAVDEPLESGAVDPGPTPPELLRVPGFINEVIDFMLETAPYPEPALAFAAALPLQAFLASRKIQDAGTTRTNLYVVAAANSGTGKDWPRSVVKRVMQSCGLGDCCGDAVASGEGLEDTLFLKPQFLLISDELHFLFNAIRHGRDPRWQGIANVLLKLYTSGADVYAMRIKASKEQSSIDQPALSICGSSIPAYLYDSMSPELLGNGLFARLLIIEAGKRGIGRRPNRRDLPESIARTAKHWAAFQPGSAYNLAAVHPSPAVVIYSDASEAILADFQTEMDAEYGRAEDAGDLAGMALWARACEKARRLALNYACSTDYRDPHLTSAGATWACDFARHQTRRMLWMAGEHVSESDFDAKRQRMIRTMRAWQQKNPGKWMPAYLITRRLKGWTPRESDEVRTALLQAGIIERATTMHDGSGRPGECFRLR